MKMNFEDITGVDEPTARAIGKEMYETLQRMDATSWGALKRKFATEKMFEVSKYRI